MKIEHVGVIGSGLMGSGIAQVVAHSGYGVTLRSRNAESAERSVARIEKNLLRLVEKGKLDETEAKEIVSRIEPTANLADVQSCDLVIESIVEDLATKRSLLADLDEIIGNDTIIATNTSTLSVTELAVATKRPERVVGIHFFNPAPIMRLVEVVAALTTSDEVTTIATEFARSCGKDPVSVADRAGFIVNALLFPYLNNAVRLLELGVADRDDIDMAMKGGCGFPIGPLALLDLVGLDTSVSILEVLYTEYGDSSMRPQPLLKRMVAADKLGRKSGSGFYEYN